MRAYLKCSLCPQKFPTNDLYIEERKKAHESKHRRDYYTNSKPEQGGGNNVIGEVKWSLTDDPK